MNEINIYNRTSEAETRVSEHFRVREFACGDGSAPVLISPALVDALEKIRVHFDAPVTISSAYRTPAYNATLKNASPKSQHCYGLAADIKVEGHTSNEVAAYAETLLPSSGGIGRYSSFVHIDVRAAKSRWKGGY